MDFCFSIAIVSLFKTSKVQNWKGFISNFQKEICSRKSSTIFYFFYFYLFFIVINIDIVLLIILSETKQRMFVDCEYTMYHQSLELDYLQFLGLYQR